MSAIDELCRMLDERGVEYEGGERSLRWRDRYGIMMQAFPLANGELGMGVWSCTPEQAVEATLGRGTCHAIDTGYATAFCSVCGAEFMGSIMTNEPPDYVKPLTRCPECGRKIVEVDA